MASTSSDVDLWFLACALDRDIGEAEKWCRLAPTEHNRVWLESVRRQREELAEAVAMSREQP